ncbi:MAG TPA: hypothetical protein VFU37_13895 [Pyrinomonadaceae bacterium]|nr:hypothetical protein [Pyrinomonadaceae bacterium]
MRIITVRSVCLGTALAVMLGAVSVFGQEKAPVPPEKELRLQTGPGIPGPELGPVAFGGPSFAFVNSEFSFDRLVKGAPYSAEAITEMTQTLSDGNRIVNTSTALVYRDSEGRTRREQTLKAIGPFTASGQPLKTIFINDPATGDAYVLHPANRVAFKNRVFQIETSGPQGEGHVVGSGRIQNFTFSRAPNGEKPIMIGEAGIRVEDEPPAPRTESLGKQTIEGVAVVGTRITITIPAGQIGNERPIEIVGESWYSPELQTTVLSRQSDPRSGEIVYRLTNINRSEPDHSLFEVPANYTIKTEPEPPEPPFQIRTKRVRPEQ